MLTAEIGKVAICFPYCGDEVASFLVGPIPDTATGFATLPRCPANRANDVAWHCNSTDLLQLL